MKVKDVGAPAGVGAAREFRGDPAEKAEAAMIVGPIVPVRTGIGIARPIVEPRLVDQISWEFRARHPREPHPHPLRREGRVQPGDIGDAGKRIEKAPEAGQQQARVNPERGQRGRQRCGNIAEPAGFDPRIELRGDVQDAERQL